MSLPCSSSSSSSVKQALAGGEHSLVLSKDGKVFSAGACGLGWCRNLPLVPSLFSWRYVKMPEKITSIYPSYYHNLAITEKGKVFSWGCGTFVDGKNDGCIPAMGIYNTSDLGEDPREVMLPTRASQISGGAYHSAILGEDGKLYTFGAGQLGQLGRQTTNRAETDSSGLPVDASPRPVEGMDGKHISSISSGFYNTFAVTTTGELYCTGENQNEQCGKQDGVKNLKKMKVVEELKGNKVVRDAKGGYCHTLILTKDGKVFSMGCGDDGQRGDGQEGGTERNGVTQVLLPNENGAVKAVAAGANHSLLLTENGSVYAFGSNEYGQCGAQSGENFTSPTRMDLPRPITSISAGYAHSVLKEEDGVIHVCGLNDSGQLGLGKQSGDVPCPRQISFK